MKKTVLKDMKHQNMELIYHLILKEGSLSRIQIAEKTSLSPSTVGSIVHDMLDMEILKEEKSQASSAGRKPILLELNADYGMIAVFEVYRTGVSCTFYNLLLEQTSRRHLTDRLPDGDQLYRLVTESIDAQSEKRLCGIGFLFQNDMPLSSFNVLYDTGVYSSLITLHDALTSKYHTAVIESFTQASTVSQMISESVPDATSAEIAVGSELRAAVVTGGKSIPVRQELLESLPDESTSRNRLSILIEQICMVFAIHSIFLISKSDVPNALVQQVRHEIDSDMHENKPEVRVIDHIEKHQTSWIAGQIRCRLALA